MYVGKGRRDGPAAEPDTDTGTGHERDEVSKAASIACCRRRSAWVGVYDTDSGFLRRQLIRLWQYDGQDTLGSKATGP